VRVGDRVMAASADRTRAEREWRPSRNLPPFTRMDLLGIAVAIVGTLALILLAAGTADKDAGVDGFVSAGRILLAVGAALINLAHVVGILFFESVNYHGVFQRFFARMSLIGTPIAVAISLALSLVG
jgi:hypothetical protein